MKIECQYFDLQAEEEGKKSKGNSYKLKIDGERESWMEPKKTFSPLGDFFPSLKRKREREREKERESSPQI